MGGKNSVFNKPLGKTGDKILGENNFFNKAINEYGAQSLTAGFGGEYGAIANTKGLVKGLGEGLGEITGSNALRKQAMDQQSANEAATKRQALMSDAAARNAGGDPTSIFLTGNRKRKSAGGGATGSAGAGSSRETGIQS